MEQRFWKKVRRGTDDECWEWIASKGNHGYGQFRVKGTMTVAHRVAYELTHGKIPEGLLVRHKCRGKCVNPAHLELGTTAQNNADMVRDKTSTRGERHANHKLTEEEVREIKHRVMNESVNAIAREYGICHQAISAIKNGLSWSWLATQ